MLDFVAVFLAALQDSHSLRQLFRRVFFSNFAEIERLVFSLPERTSRPKTLSNRPVSRAAIPRVTFLRDILILEIRPGMPKNIALFIDGTWNSAADCATVCTSLGSVGERLPRERSRGLSACDANLWTLCL